MLAPERVRSTHGEYSTAAAGCASPASRLATSAPSASAPPADTPNNPIRSGRIPSRAGRGRTQARRRWLPGMDAPGRAGTQPRAPSRGPAARAGRRGQRLREPTRARKRRRETTGVRRLRRPRHRNPEDRNTTKRISVSDASDGSGVWSMNSSYTDRSTARSPRARGHGAQQSWYDFLAGWLISGALPPKGVRRHHLIPMRSSRHSRHESSTIGRPPA